MAVEGGVEMITIKATVRGGRLEVDEPIELPDGTELLIPIPNGVEKSPDPDAPRSPEEIARILAIMDRLEPLEMADEELAAWGADRMTRKEREKARAAEDAERLRRMWE
jgi:hypothetical protein